MTYTVKTRGFERSALVMRGRETVAEVFTDREAADQHRTASLFAAAPDLLAALMEAAEIIESTGLDASPARAAIAKAQGE